MDKQRLEAVGIVRQALMPLLKEYFAEERDLAKVATEMLPLLERVEKRLGESPKADIAGLSEVLGRFEDIAKRDVKVARSPALDELMVKMDMVLAQKGQTVADMNQYKPHDQDQDGEAASYYGFADAQGNWYITQHMNGEQRYAAGSSNYTDNWSKHQKLTYATLAEAFGNEV